MKELLEYIYTEVKCKRLSREDAVDLICQFENHNLPHQTPLLHPLLHRNTSGFSGQQFSSTFSGEEFFLKDYYINDHRAFPGVALLEMARAAVEAATMAPDIGVIETLTDNRKAIRLKNIVWVGPIIVREQPINLHIRLFLDENNTVVFEIYRSVSYSDSGSVSNNVEPEIYCQGNVQLTGTSGISILDLQLLQNQCHQILSTNEVYEAFQVAGTTYGPGYRGIKEIYIGQNQILANLSLPTAILNTQNQLFLHPIIMDAALQASDFFVMGTDHPKPAIPSSLTELEILGKCTSTMWALIRYSDGGQIIEKQPKLDIDLCDELGTICVRMKGYGSRVLEEEFNSVELPAIGTLMLKTNWKEQLITPELQPLVYDQHLVICCEMAHFNIDDVSPEIMRQISGIRWLNLQSNRQGAARQHIAQRFEDYAVQVFKEIQSILITKPAGRIFIQVTISNQGESQLFGGLSGLLKTTRLENPKLTGQIIEVNQEEELHGIITKLKENSQSPHDQFIRYQDGEQSVFSWTELETLQELNSVERRGHLSDHRGFRCTGADICQRNCNSSEK